MIRGQRLCLGERAYDGVPSLISLLPGTITTSSSMRFSRYISCVWFPRCFDLLSVFSTNNHSIHTIKKKILSKCLSRSFPLSFFLPLPISPTPFLNTLATTLVSVRLRPIQSPASALPTIKNLWLLLVPAAPHCQRRLAALGRPSVGHSKSQSYRVR
jgi:hypothetical protein